MTVVFFWNIQSNAELSIVDDIAMTVKMRSNWVHFCHLGVVGSQVKSSELYLCITFKNNRSCTRVLYS